MSGFLATVEQLAFYKIVTIKVFLTLWFQIDILYVRSNWRPNLDLLSLYVSFFFFALWNTLMISNYRITESIDFDQKIKI